MSDVRYLGSLVDPEDYRHLGWRAVLACWLNVLRDWLERRIAILLLTAEVKAVGVKDRNKELRIIAEASVDNVGRDRLHPTMRRAPRSAISDLLKEWRNGKTSYEEGRKNHEKPEPMKPLEESPFRTTLAMASMRRDRRTRYVPGRVHQVSTLDGDLDFEKPDEED